MRGIDKQINKPAGQGESRRMRERARARETERENESGEPVILGRTFVGEVDGLTRMVDAVGPASQTAWEEEREKVDKERKERKGPTAVVTQRRVFRPSRSSPRVYPPARAICLGQLAPPARARARARTHFPFRNC